MSDRPETRYAWNGDVALAYQVFGEGPVDLVYVQGYCSHVDLNWNSLYLARFLRGLSAHARVIMTDRRGWGCSDRFSPGDLAPLEVQVDDLGVVMDAAGADRAVVFGSWETALTATLFAAANPGRTSGLVLCDPFVSFLATPETPWMYSQADWDEINQRVREAWGTPDYRRESGDFADEPEFLDWFLPWTRAAVAPGALAAESDRFASVDVRDVLPTIQVPTLVSGAMADEMMQQNARFVAETIPGAQLIESSPGRDTGWFHWYGRGPAIVEAVGELVSRVRRELETFDRVLATVLFTDIVDSTATGAAMGDRAWGEVRERHDRIVRSDLARFGGREVKTMGDGFLATFDGPARAVRCAEAIVAAVRSLGIEIRAGLHTGEIKLERDDVSGIGVAIGARVGAMAGPSQVLVSQTVKDLVVGSGLEFEDAGEHELKGVPERWRLYRVAE